MYRHIHIRIHRHIHRRIHRRIHRNIHRRIHRPICIFLYLFSVHFIESWRTIGISLATLILSCLVDWVTVLLVRPLLGPSSSSITVTLVLLLLVVLVTLLASHVAPGLLEPWGRCLVGIVLVVIVIKTWMEDKPEHRGYLLVEN